MTVPMVELWQYVPMVMTHPATWCFPDMTGSDFTSHFSAWQSTYCQPISTVPKSATESESNLQTHFIREFWGYCRGLAGDSFFWDVTLHHQVFGPSVSKHSVIVSSSSSTADVSLYFPKPALIHLVSDIWYMLSVYQIKSLSKSSTSVFFCFSHMLPVLKCWLVVSADSCTP